MTTETRSYLTNDPRRQQDGQACPWLALHGTRNYAPFQSREWRLLEQTLQAVATGRIACPTTQARN